MMYLIRTAIVFSYMSAVTSAEYSPVLTWDVCSPSRIVVTLTGGIEGGIIYIRGYGSACKQDTTPAVTVHEFVFETCGIAKAETYFTIIVQKNPLYQTGDDIQESLICIYDLSEISISSDGLKSQNNEESQGINVTVKPSGAMTPYKDGSDVSQSGVKLSDKITMTIQLNDEYIEDFDVKAKSCTANYLDIVVDYCSTDTDLFPNFEHVTKGVVTSTFGAFRTTDMGGGPVEMVFTCTVELCLGLCEQEVCDGSSRRKKRAVNRDSGFDNLNLGSSLSVGSDTELIPVKNDADNSVCIANLVFIVVLIMILVILVTSLGMTSFVTGKLLKRTQQLRKLTNIHEAQQEGPKQIIRNERRPSVSVINTNMQTITVRNARSDNTQSDQRQHIDENEKEKTKMSDTDELKSHSSVSIMYNSSAAYQSATKSMSHLCNQKNSKAAKNAENVVSRSAGIGSGISLATNRKLTTRPEVTTLSEDELNKLKQCRDMLKVMGIRDERK